ncbi:MAG: DUF2283 domain-containing protein [Caldilineaceae bacterium]|nr:DUF2283 domain-containing protein [Caldilineaceae bacterium]
MPTTKVIYDREVDALYIRFTDTTVTTKHLEDGIALDYDASNHLVGIEILDAAQRLANPQALTPIDSLISARRETEDQFAANSSSRRFPNFTFPGSGNIDPKNWAAIPANP